MLNINEFLKKFQTLKPPQETIKRAMEDALIKETKIQFHGDLKISNNVVYVKSSPAMKNEIFLHKKQIIERMKITMGKNTPRDIL